jgi:protein-S-isoprenylcysteine O-methyltransferase Ste14
VKGRGGEWVVGQFVLMALIFAAVVVPPDWPEGIQTPLRVAGAISALVGAAVVWRAARAMGRSLTPFPEPAAGARLVDAGPFRFVRHPTYAGGLAFLLGWSLFAGPVALALTVALGLLWVGKARVEERRLRARFPEYASYETRVRARLIPWVY